MKKTLSILLVAAATLAACTKSEIAYEQPQEIGFNVVAGNMTKAPVQNDAIYPTDLNMYVFAQTTDNTAESVNYFSKVLFEYKQEVDNNNCWGGNPAQYWPNETKLHFSGYSASGNVATTATVAYDANDDKLSISNYSPGEGKDAGVNDLMWFPSTKYANSEGYSKADKYVSVNMYHTCSWITFMVQGDATTGGSASSYTITQLKMNGVDKTADVTCTGADLSSSDPSQSTSSLYSNIVWSNNDDQTDATTPDNVTYTVTMPDNGIELSNTYTAGTDGAAATETPKNIETNATKTTGGNIVVIPQKPGTIDLAWTYNSSTNAAISDSATGLSLKISDTESENVWQPGKHYVYTITIKANEILIAPTPVNWVDGTTGTVTIE